MLIINIGKYRLLAKKLLKTRKMNTRILNLDLMRKIATGVTGAVLRKPKNPNKSQQGLREIRRIQEGENGLQDLQAE